MKETICKIIILLSLLALSGCTTIQETGELPESTKNTVKAGMDIWCGNLTNLRRIALRVIHVVDPEWQSVCVTRNQGATEA